MIFVVADKTLVVGDVSVQPMAHSVENSGHSSLRRANGGNEKPNLNDQIYSQEDPAKSSDGLTKPLANGRCSHAIEDENASSDAARFSTTKHAFNTSTLPQWELSLMTKLNGCGGQHVKQNNILNHSNASAFSR